MNSGKPASPDLVVTCALIVRDGRVLCAQRSATMVLPLKWEFPGGKLEPGESPEACIRREIREELNLEIKVFDRGPSFYSPYKGGGRLELLPCICAWKGGELLLREHLEVRWCSITEMEALDWAEADCPILDWFRDVYSARVP